VANVRSWDKRRVSLRILDVVTRSSLDTINRGTGVILTSMSLQIIGKLLQVGQGMSVLVDILFEGFSSSRLSWFSYRFGRNTFDRRYDIVESLVVQFRQQSKHLRTLQNSFPDSFGNSPR